MIDLNEIESAPSVFGALAAIKRVCEESGDDPARVIELEVENQGNRLPPNAVAVSRPTLIAFVAAVKSLRAVEWSGRIGFGFEGETRVCPSCEGAEPSDRNKRQRESDWPTLRIGHESGCAVAAALNQFRIE